MIASTAEDSNKMTNENSSLSTEQTPAAVSGAELKPIEGNSRIDTMDILRGFALIGIALMNVEWFNRVVLELGRFDFNLSGSDWAAGWLVRLFVEGKFYKLFSILFGMGFAVMLLRAQEVGRPFYGWFSRRMFFLFIFGMAHMLFLWTGDILHDYAVGGLILLLWVWLIHKFKRLHFLQQSKWFLRVGLGMLALPYIVSMFAGIYFGATRTEAVMLEENQKMVDVRARADEIKLDPVLSAQLIAEDKAEEEARKKGEEVKEDKAEAEDEELSREEEVEKRAKERFVNRHNNDEDKQEERDAFTQPSWIKAVEFRAEQSKMFLMNTPFFATIISFPLFMIGYWFVASGVMRRPQDHIGLFKVMMWVGLGVGIFMSIGPLLLLVNPARKFVIEIQGVANMQFQFSQMLMTAGYIGAISLACLTLRGKKLLGWLAPMGRMALTNYLMHSLILSSIFYGHWGAMFGQIQRAEQVGIIAAIIAFQAVFSAIWLKLFRFGPLEWLWRCLTYMKLQPMRHADKDAAQKNNNQAAV